jgi:hypothetical protein
MSPDHENVDMLGTDLFLMDGKGIERPSNVAAVDETFKKAAKAKARGSEQSTLEL